MDCKYHGQIKATNTCSVCSEWICQDYLLNIKGRNYCKDCLKEILENNNYLQKAESSKLKIEKHTYKKVSLKNTLSYIDKKVGLKEILFYGISLIPGCGQIYLGNSIKGISLLSITILLIFGFDLTFGLPIYFYSFFDALILRRKIKNNNLKTENLEPLNINKNPNNLLTLCFSLIPGCGQMYLGYTYYGLLLNAIFFIILFISEFQFFSIVPFLFSFFNAIYLRKQILNGVYFDDSLKSILKIIKPSFSNNKAKKEIIIDKRIKKSEREN